MGLALSAAKDYIMLNWLESVTHVRSKDGFFLSTSRDFLLFSQEALWVILCSDFRRFLNQWIQVELSETQSN